MDRSFLSKPQVIAAARSFVCIRLTTYENAAEADLLRSLAPTGSGELENTVFCILSPDGKRALVRGSRSTRQAFRDADAMAAAMTRAGHWYPPLQAGKTTADLPMIATVRLAVDVAACDNQPAVILVGSDAGRQSLRSSLARLAWSDDFRGRLVYVQASRSDDVAIINGAKPSSGLLVVQPDRFGLKATVLAQAPADATTETLAAILREGLARHRAPFETFQEHVRQGHETGAFWETAIPVTDPMEQAAREHGRRNASTPP